MDYKVSNIRGGGKMTVIAYKLRSNKVIGFYVLKKVFQVIGSSVVLKDGNIKRFDRDSTLLVIKEGLYAK